MDGLHVRLESVSSRRDSAVDKLGGFYRKSICGRILGRPCADVFRTIISLTDTILNDKAVSLKMFIDIFSEEFRISE
jgi:hypothetical protein